MLARCPQTSNQDLCHTRKPGAQPEKLMQHTFAQVRVYKQNFGAPSRQRDGQICGGYRFAFTGNRAGDQNRPGPPPQSVSLSRARGQG